MGMRKRTAGRFQVEALEPRWTPGGAPGGVVNNTAVYGVGEEIPQVQVAHVDPLGGPKRGVDRAVMGVGEEIPQRA